MPAQSSDELRCFYGREFSGSAKKRPDTPLLNFAGINSATARPVPAGLSRRQMTSPRGLLRSAPAALARGLGVVARLAARRPVASSQNSAGRHGAARRGRPPSPAPRAPGPGRRRTAGAAPGRRPVPCASADRSLGALRSAAAGPAPASPPPRCCTPAGRCTGGLHGNGGSTHAKTRRGLAGRAGSRFAAVSRTSSEATLFLAQNWPGCSAV